MNEEDNWIIMEQSQYIQEKLRTPSVLQKKHERELSMKE